MDVVEKDYHEKSNDPDWQNKPQGDREQDFDAYRERLSNASEVKISSLCRRELLALETNDPALDKSLPEPPEAPPIDSISANEEDACYTDYPIIDARLGTEITESIPPGSPPSQANDAGSYAAWPESAFPAISRRYGDETAIAIESQRRPACQQPFLPSNDRDSGYASDGLNGLSRKRKRLNVATKHNPCLEFGLERRQGDYSADLNDPNRVQSTVIIDIQPRNVDRGLGFPSATSATPNGGLDILATAISVQQTLDTMDHAVYISADEYADNDFNPAGRISATTHHQTTSNIDGSQPPRNQFYNTTSTYGHQAVGDNAACESSVTGNHTETTYQPALSANAAVAIEPVRPISPSRPSGGATLAPQVGQPLTGREFVNSANQPAEHPPVVSPDSFISAPLHSLPYQDPSQDLSIYEPDYSSTTDFLNVDSCQSDSLTSTSCLTATEPDNTDNTRLTTPSQRIESTVRSRNIRSTSPIPGRQQLGTLSYTNCQAAEQLARNAQEQTDHHIHCGISQSGQGTSSSLRRRHEDVQEFFFSCHELLLSPFQPQALFASESLFRNTDIYFTNLCERMSFDAHGIILNQNGIRSTNELCNDFDSYCFTATMLFRRNQHIEFGHALSKAFALVKQILQAQHPRTLTCFLEVFIHLIQIGLPGVANVLRRFIKNMATEIIGDGQPWGQICRLLDELDSESLDECMAQLWNRIADTFENELGPSSRLAVSVRLDYIKRVYGVSNKLEEERLLRDLLGRFYDVPNQSTPRIMLNLAHNLNRQELHADAETLAWQVLSLLEDHEMYVERIAERIECLKIVSHSQFCAGNIAAEKTMREAIQMIVHHWGIHHSWALEFKTVLWSWLKDWSREEDANELFEEIEVLRKDEQVDGA